MILQGQGTCRIHHFPGEEQVSPKGGQRDQKSVRFLTDTLCVYCLVLGTCLQNEV